MVVLKPYLQKIDKRTKDILKIFKDLNQLFDHTKSVVSCDDLVINENRKKKQEFSLLYQKICYY